MAYQPPDASQHFSQPIQPQPSQPMPQLGWPSQPMYPPGQPSQPVYPPPGYYSPPQYPMQSPYQPPYYPYQQPGWIPMPRRMNHKAEQALMFGVLSLLLGILCGIPAIILGLMALSEIQRTGEDGTSKANTGLFLGILSFVIAAALYYRFFA